MSKPGIGRPEPTRDRGFSMPALLAMLAIMTLSLLIAMPSWRYLTQDDREQELIFRGRQIAGAIARFQRKNGNAFPASMEQLVQGKYLRKDFKDPMTKDGKWRILRPGEGVPAQPGVPGGGQPGQPPGPAPSASPSPTPRSTFGGNTGGQGGPIAGVVSLSTEKGLRSVNGSPNYNRWIFAPNVPFNVGGQATGAGGPLVPSPRGPRVPDAEAVRLSR